jgi:hypothetical protein
MKHVNYWRRFLKTDNWNLDKGNEPTMKFGYQCVGMFSVADKFKDVSERLNLDRNVILKVAKPFAKHVALPKEEFSNMNLLNY